MVKSHSVLGFGFVVELPLTPALSRREREPMVGLSKFAFNSISQVGVAPPNTSITPLSPWKGEGPICVFFNA